MGWAGSVHSCPGDLLCLSHMLVVSRPSTTLLQELLCCGVKAATRPAGCAQGVMLHLDPELRDFVSPFLELFGDHEAPHLHSWRFCRITCLPGQLGSGSGHLRCLNHSH